MTKRYLVGLDLGNQKDFAAYSVFDCALGEQIAAGILPSIDADQLELWLRQNIERLQQASIGFVYEPPLQQ